MIKSSLYKRLIQLTSTVFLFSLLSGCGFHLKQSYNIAPELENITLVSAKYSELTRFIKQELRYSQINLITAPTDSTPVLKIASETSKSRTVSLYNDASAAEYERGYEVKIEVKLPNQDPQYFTIALQRDQLNNSQEALASSREAELLQKELRQAAAKQIVRTLSQVVIAPYTATAIPAAITPAPALDK